MVPEPSIPHTHTAPLPAALPSWGPCFSSYGIAILASVSGAGTRSLRAPLCGHPGPSAQELLCRGGALPVQRRTEHQMKKRLSLSASLACAVSSFHLKYCRKISHL